MEQNRSDMNLLRANRSDMSAVSPIRAIMYKIRSMSVISLECQGL